MAPQAIIQAQTTPMSGWREFARCDATDIIIRQRMESVQRSNPAARVRAVDASTQRLIDIL